MVKLAFKILVPMTLIESWDYFSDFTTMGEWDPNVSKSVRLPQKEDTIAKKKKQNKRIGQQYNITVDFKGSKSDILYTVIQCDDHEKIRMTGSNSLMTFQENIFFSFNKQNQTIIQYVSYVELKGPLCIFLPCIRSSLYEAGQKVKERMINRSREFTKQKIKQKKAKST